MKRVLFLLLFITPILSYSQNEAAIWYFGQNAGLDFNSGTPVVLTDGQINTYEGCATISDSLGNLLFYTDGVTVYDRTHNIMQNGNGLSGNSSSTQSAIIVQKPNNLNQYYIFTVDENAGASPNQGGIDYSIVDLTLNGTLGAITTKNSLLLDNSYEKITAIKNANNNDYWIITFFIDRYYAWELNATGLNTTPIISTAGISSINDTSRGYLKISTDGSKIANANFGNTPRLFLYDFNNSTGVVSNEVPLLFEDNKDNPYGVEFSPLTQKLYVTTCQIDASGISLSPPGKLYQFDLLNSNLRTKIDESNVYTRNALQLAIDGKIYRALSKVTTGQNLASGSNYLGVINNPELDGLASIYVEDFIDITIGGTFPTHRVFEGLPPFMSSIFLEPTITANEVCFGIPTQFTVNSSSPIASITWDFGDPVTGIDNTSTLENPTHLFSSSGIFSITATVTVGTITTILTMDVTIYPIPIITTPVTLIQCDDDLDGFVDFNLEEANTIITIESPAPIITYFLTETDALSNIDPITTPTTFSNSVSNIVWARVENTTNCIATAQVNLLIETTNIPSDLMISFNSCDDDIDGDNTNGIALFDFSSATNQILDALLPQTNLEVSYYENMTDALAEQNNIDPTNYRNTNSPTSQQIVVRVDNLANECFGLGYHITLNVTPIPIFDLASTFCIIASSNSISVENPSETYDYIWIDELNNIVGNTDTITVTTEGIYTVTVNNQNVTNCETTKSIQVSSIQIITPVTLIQCDDDLDGFVDFNLEEANTIITIESPAPIITYFLTETDALSNIDPITTPTTFSNSVSNIVWARVENTTNCIATAQVNLLIETTNIPSDLMISFNSCDDDIDGDNTNGIALFDFSSATNQILDALLPQTNLEVSYYENMTDALAEQNNIDPTNYRNTNSPTSQQIVVRVDNLANECFGLGYHVTLNVTTAPIFDLANAVSLCLSSSNSKISIENPFETYNYIWTDDFNNILGNSPEISISTEGIYFVTAINPNEVTCETTKSIQVSAISPTELLNFNSDNLQKTDNSSNNTITVLTNNLPNSNYQFALDSDEFQTNNIFENVSSGIHTVKIIDKENCLEASAKVSLIGIPNFFTPNNDGFNDTWQVTGVSFQPNSNIYIHDRFGKMIAILDPLGPGWDGLYKGNPLPSTDYWYRVELEDGRILRGHFSLIRK